VHPGYGFLSERAAFAAALEEAASCSIRPNRRAIEAMGDKIESKKFAQCRRSLRRFRLSVRVIESPEHAA